jgi:hypothetical protein
VGGGKETTMTTGYMRATILLGTILVAGLTPGAALAKGGFKGRFGSASFKAFKRSTTCEYVTSSGFFQLTGVSKPKIHLSSRTVDEKWAQMGGAAGADRRLPAPPFRS